MSTTATYDIDVRQGLILAEPFAPMAPDPVTGTLEPVDYTGHTATFTIYGAPATLDSLHDGPVIFTGTDASGTVELGLFDGGEFGLYGILLYLTQAQTSALDPWGRGVYNLDVIDPYGHPQLRIQGVITLEEGTKHV
jgi:hypothetical protein